VEHSRAADGTIENGVAVGMVVWCEPEHYEGTRLNRTANYRAAPASAVTAEDERARHDGGIRLVARCTGFYVSVGIAGFIRHILVMGFNARSRPPMQITRIGTPLVQIGTTPCTPFQGTW
jgi:hypothetical protein